MKTSNQFLRTPIIRYSSVMRVGKQHPIRISLTGANDNSEPVKPQSLSGGFDPPILVQVTIPGALVTPTHQIIPLSGGDANFIIQPISSGKLKGAKVEFMSQGRKVSELPLPIKANKGKLAKWLITIGILLPFIINLIPPLAFQDRIDFANDIPKPTATSKDGPGITPGSTIPGGKSNLSTQGGRTKQATPAKPSEKNPEKTSGKPSATLFVPEHSLQALAQMVIFIQPPTISDKSNPSGKTMTSEAPIEDGDKGSSTKNANTFNSVLTYRGEDAIWAWVRHRLSQNGYRTNLLFANPESGELSRFFTIDRSYQIVGENNKEWNTSRLSAIGLYYLEPVLRLLYRVFIQFPKDIPFGDLGLGLLFVGLGILAWVMTGPNRKKIKGSVMDIRLAS